MKAYIQNGELFFNSNSKGLISFGNAKEVAIFGIADSDLPQGWSSTQILQEAGFDEWESAIAVSTSSDMLSNDWLFQTLLGEWKKGRVIRFKESQIDKRMKKTIGGDVEDGFMPSSGNTWVTETWSAIQTTVWSVDDEPFVTIIQEDQNRSNRIEFPVILGRRSQYLRTIQVEVTQAGTIKI